MSKWLSLARETLPLLAPLAPFVPPKASPNGPNEVNGQAPAIAPAADVEERYLYEERAALREYDGEFPRKTAEILAWRDIKERGR